MSAFGFASLALSHSLKMASDTDQCIKYCSNVMGFLWRNGWFVSFIVCLAGIVSVYGNGLACSGTPLLSLFGGTTCAKYSLTGELMAIKNYNTSALVFGCLLTLVVACAIKCTSEFDVACPVIGIVICALLMGVFGGMAHALIAAWQVSGKMRNEWQATYICLYIAA